jgi:hypothetical protein
MKNLDKKSTIIFSRLLEILANHDWMKLVMTNRLPLTIKKIRVFENTSKGKVILIGLIQEKEQTVFVEGMPTFMRFPEMRFLVMEGRSEGMSIYPQFFAKDSQPNLVREAITLSITGEITEVDTEFQAKLCTMAVDWLSILEKEGFLLFK